VGLIHVRPILDLRLQEDIDRMNNIARGAFELVQRYGGSFSGEHGDGRVRSPFIPRFFGDRLYGALKEVKALFDPRGLMNPGIIIDAGPMDRNLRYGTSYKRPGFATEYHYRADGGMAAAVELCTGVGDCRQTLVGTMCPSYRATRDEEHSTRGRANALRLAMTGQLGPDELAGKRLMEVFDLCLSCKACKAECPSNVDMARLKSELLQKVHDAHGADFRERLVANSARTAALFSGWCAPVINTFQRAAPVRKLLQLVAGIDSRRVLPDYASRPFPKWFARRPQRNGSGKKVVLFDDTYMNHHEPSVGIYAVELLESCGYEVILARAGCCQRPKISHGFLREARREGEATLRNLDHLIRQGLTVVVCEPGCASALVDDLPDLIDDDALGGRIQENVVMIDAFLARELQEGRLDCTFVSDYEDIVIHGHCHQKSLFSRTAMQEILDRVEGVSVQLLDTGCCGMAGSFGYEQEHYVLSMQIGEERLFPAIRSRPDGAAVVACGFSCRHQIEHGTGVKSRHFVEVVRRKQV
jgi:Fe-S oxidoreductase